MFVKFKNQFLLNDNNLNHISFLTFFICALPIALVDGPFFSDLIVSCSAIFFLGFSIVKKNFLFLKNKIIVILLFFSFFILCRSFFASNIMLSLESSLFYIRFIFFSLCICYLINSNKNFLKFFAISISVTFFVLYIDSFLQFFLQKNIFWQDNFTFLESQRISSFFGDELKLGGFLSKTFPLLVALMIAVINNKKIFSILMILNFLLTPIVIYLSGERSAFFLILLSSILMILCLNNFKFIRFVILIFSILLIGATSYFKPEIFSRMVEKTINQSTQTELYKERYKNEKSKYYDLVNQNNFFIFSFEHQGLYFIALEMFKDNILFGQGPKMYRELFNQEPYSDFTEEFVEITQTLGVTHPHNTYVQLLTETGLIGFGIVFTLFILLFLILFKQFLYVFFIKKYFLDDYKICLIICFVINLWPLIPTGSFFNNWNSIIYFLPLGFYLAQYEQK